MRLSPSILLAAWFGLIPLRGFGQDAGSNSAASATSGNSTTTPPAPDITARQQVLQLTKGFFLELKTASLEERIALNHNFKQQLADLFAAIPPPSLSPAQQSANEATRQARIQLLPTKAQLIFAMMQERRQLIQQISTASPDERPALIAQFTQLSAQQTQTLSSLDSSTGISNTPSQTVTPDAIAQHRQALQAVLLLPPNERAAAMHANFVAAQAAKSSDATVIYTSSGDSSSDATSPQPSNP